MKSKIFLFIFAIFLIKIMSGATTYLDNGACYNFTFQESTCNNSTNQTIFSNRTETFCSNVTQEDSLGYCSIDSSILPGEIFKKQDSSCNVNLKCELNTSFFKHEVPFDVTADMDFIRITIGTDTKSYPRDADGFTYNGIKTVMCPTLEEQAFDETPKSLDDCLSILKDTKDLTSDERTDYKQCQADRDNFKVEWEKRGIQIDDCNKNLGNANQKAENCEDNFKSASVTNWVFIIMDIILASSWIIFLFMRLKSKTGGDL